MSRSSKCLIILVSLVASALTFALYQTAQKSSSKEERTKNELMQLERDIGKANVQRDYAFFERVEADEFIFTDSGGGLTTRKEDLESVKGPVNPDSKLLAYDVDD